MPMTIAKQGLAAQQSIQVNANPEERWQHNNIPCATEG
jgi:hypothetical protein